MKCWMKELAARHERMKKLYRRERLIVVFDIDDTILDLRHMILHVLSAFDKLNETGYFTDLSIQDIGVSEFGVHRMMAEFGIPAPEQQKVIEWFMKHSWSKPVIRDGHRPFPGVMEVIRWLQSQKETFVGLNTGRPETMRRETLQSLNRIGRPLDVTFHDHLLFMNRYGWAERIEESKVEGIAHFQRRGFRVVAFVDNEPANLQAVADYDRTGEILLLHADTVFTSLRERIPECAVSGNVYDISALVRGSSQSPQWGEAA